MVPRAHKELLTDYLISESLKRLQLTLDKNFPQIQVAQVIGTTWLSVPTWWNVLGHQLKTDYPEPRREDPSIVILWMLPAVKVGSIHISKRHWRTLWKKWGRGCQKCKDTEWHPLKVQISKVYCFVTDLLLLLPLDYGSHKVSLGLLDYVLTLEFQI